MPNCFSIHGIAARNLLLLLMLLLSCLFLISCANKPLLVKGGTQVAVLQVCMNFANHIEGDEKLLYLNAISEFIDDYNATPNALKLQSCTKGLKKSLHVTVQNTRFIDPNKQALYVGASTIGLAYPLSGGSFGFFWLAMNGTSLQLSLSPDLSEENKAVNRYFSTWPYFYDLEALKAKHMNQFQEFMLETMIDIEKNLVAAQK